MDASLRSPVRSGLAANALIVTALGLAVLLGIAAGSHSLSLLAAIVYAGVLAASVVWWRIGVPGILVVGTIDGFIKHATDASAAYILKDALLASTLLGLLVWCAANPDARPKTWRGALPLVLYVGYLLTEALHPALGIASSVAALREHVLFALLYIVGAAYFTTSGRLARFSTMTIALATFAAAVGILEYHFPADWMRLGPGFALASLHYETYAIGADAAQTAPGAALGLGAAIFRSYATLVDPAALGLFCAFGMTFAVAALGRTTFLGRLGLIAAIATMGVGLLYSGSRSAIACLAVGCVVVALLALAHKKTRFIPLVGFATLLAAVPIALVTTHGTALDRLTVAKSIDYAAGTRTRSQDVVLAMLPSHPFGVGLGATGAGGAIGPGSQAVAVDNAYFAALFESGVLGLAFFVLVQVSFAWLAVRAALRATSLELRTSYLGIAGVQCGILVAGVVTQGALDYAPLAQIYWLACGALAVNQTEKLPCA
jgi:hypothetical protein